MEIFSIAFEIYKYGAGIILALVGIIITIGIVPLTHVGVQRLINYINPHHIPDWEKTEKENMPFEFEVTERCPEYLFIADRTFSVESIEAKNVGIGTSDKMEITLNLKGPE